jgi:hypothetical protein
MKNRITFCGIVCLFFAFQAVFGTEQVPDKIIYNGKKYKLLCEPLENYFEKYVERPITEIRSSALWRGYTATLEIKDNQLFIKDIEIQRDGGKDESGRPLTNMKSVLNEVFPDQELVKMDWFTGLLLAVYDGENNYNIIYYSQIEHSILLEIENGNLKKVKQLANEKELKEFKEKQIQAFKETEEYQKIKAELEGEEDYSEEFIDSPLRNDIIRYHKGIYYDGVIEAWLRGNIIRYSTKILVEDDEK